jgi:hypothetical protein
MSLVFQNIDPPPPSPPGECVCTPPRCWWGGGRTHSPGGEGGRGPIFWKTTQIFPEMKLRGLVPSFHIHVSVSDLCFPTIGPPILLQKIGGRIVGIYKSLTDT